MTNKIPNILGDQLKDAREKAELSLETLAKKASLSFKQLEEIENGGDSFFIPPKLNSSSLKKLEKCWA